MTQTAERLVGRTAELETLAAATAALSRGRPAALALAGEPGIGKTRLLAELAERAERDGHLVLAGGASELERELPFCVFVDALDEHAEALEPRVLDGLDEHTRAELAHVLPSLDANDRSPGAGLQPVSYTHLTLPTNSRV